MATAQIRPDWTIGTLNLTAGVVEFTTTDSLLETAAIQAGDSLITESGLVLIIADITGQNSGTLMEPCPAGAAGVGQPLRVRFQPDGSRYNGATADLVQLLGSGNVYEFAGLDGAGGGVPVFTGAGTMDVVPSGDVGIQDPNGSLGELAGLALAADKILNTDGSGNLTQSDITSAALVLLKLTGTAAANKLPYFTGANTAALADLRSFAQWNWIYNGDFSINQRGGPKKPANGVYGFDMWKGHANGIQQIVEALPAGEYTLTWSGGGTGYLGSASGASPLKATVVSGNTSVVVPQTATNVSLVMGDATGRDPWMPRSHGVELFLCQRYYEAGSAECFAIHRTLAVDVVVSKIIINFKATKRVSPTTIIGYTYQDNASWIRTHNLEGRTVDRAIAVLMTGSGGYCDVNFNWAADASL